jgi:hypothetical protein
VSLLATSVDGVSEDAKPALVRRAVFEFEKGQSWDQSNSDTRAPWSDDELRVVLSRAPTHENTLRLAWLWQHRANLSVGRAKRETDFR